MKTSLRAQFLDLIARSAGLALDVLRVLADDGEHPARIALGIRRRR